MSGNESLDKGASPDPGWNDPPLFSYDDQQSTIQNLKRPQLTKRIPFNEDSKSTVINNLPRTLLLPPVGEKPSGVPLDSLTKSDSSQFKKLEESEISLPAVLENFEIVICEVYSSDNEKAAGEVKRRLLVMSDLWNAGKFSSYIKEKIHRISEAIKEGNLDEADSLQRSLMVDYSPLCSSWMSGIRHLMNSRRLQPL